MPELSKDTFGDAMAQAFFLRELPLDHHVDHHSHVHQQPFFHGSSYSPAMYKPPHLERQKTLGMSAHAPLSLSDPNSFLRHASSFLHLPLEFESCHQQPQHQYHHQKLELESCHEQPQHQHHHQKLELESSQQQQQQQQHQHHHHQQQTVNGFSPYVLPHYQPLQLEVPEIEECSTWMSDVLDDFPAISTPELPPLVSPASFDAIPAPDFSCPVSLPPISLRVSQPQHTSLSCLEEDSTGPPPQPTTPPTAVNSSAGVTSPKSAILDDVSSLSPTPKPLKPRVSSRRCQRVSEKPKKVTNVEQLEHVRRERQRRDDMSFKISTLECLLPPAGPNLKRDRASIVHDSVHYVKSLQEKVEELKKTLEDLKLQKSTRAAPRRDAVKVGNPELASDSSKSHLVEYHIQVQGEGEAAARLEKCRCRPDFMSSAMKVLEHLNLDVCRCTITKMFDYTICVLIVKPRLTSNHVATSASVVSAFRSSLQL